MIENKICNKAETRIENIYKLKLKFTHKKLVQRLSPAGIITS